MFADSQPTLQCPCYVPKGAQVKITKLCAKLRSRALPLFYVANSFIKAAARLEIAVIPEHNDFKVIKNPFLGF
jgi:hypothetical protein